MNITNRRATVFPSGSKTAGTETYESLHMSLVDSGDVVRPKSLRLSSSDLDSSSGDSTMVFSSPSRSPDMCSSIRAPLSDSRQTSPIRNSPRLTEEHDHHEPQ